MKTHTPIINEYHQAKCLNTDIYKLPTFLIESVILKDPTIALHVKNEQLIQVYHSNEILNSSIIREGEIYLIQNLKFTLDWSIPYKIKNENTLLHISGKIDYRFCLEKLDNYVKYFFTEDEFRKHLTVKIINEVVLTVNKYKIDPKNQIFFDKINQKVITYLQEYGYEIIANDIQILDQLIQWSMN